MGAMTCDGPGSERLIWERRQPCHHASSMDGPDVAVTQATSRRLTVAPSRAKTAACRAQPGTEALHLRNADLQEDHRGLGTASSSRDGSICTSDAGRAWLGGQRAGL